MRRFESQDLREITDKLRIHNHISYAVILSCLNKCFYFIILIIITITIIIIIIIIIIVIIIIKLKLIRLTKFWIFLTTRAKRKSIEEKKGLYSNTYKSMMRLGNEKVVNFWLNTGNHRNPKVQTLQPPTLHQNLEKKNV